MRTTLYKCEDYPHNSVCAEVVDEEDGGKLSGCVSITIKTYSEERTVYLHPEDAMHFAETIKGLVTQVTAKKESYESDSNPW